MNSMKKAPEKQRLYDNSLFHKLMIAVAIIIVVIFAVEITLKACCPYRYKLSSYRLSDVARMYGWGNHPHETYINFDPDTGEVYTCRINNHGWRDLDRTYENPRGAYRILIIGDSVTFGSVVPLEKTYPQILETMLTDHGYNVEVLNMGYGGWGTDQEYEALIHSGVKFKPNLLISQYCSNDPAAGESPRKPFYYTLDNGVLQRHEHTVELLPAVDSFTDFLMVHSEIVQRIKAFFDTRSIRSGIKTSYFVNEKCLQRLQLSFGVDKNDTIISELAAFIDKPVTENEIRAILEKSGAVDDIQKALMIFEDRWFQIYWSEGGYTWGKQDPDSPNWQIYFALIKEMRKAAEAIGCDFAICSDNDIGHYEWELIWSRMSPNDEARTNYVDHSRVIKEFALADGIGYVDNRYVIERARNDPHPNIAGYEALAKSIYEYLMENYRDELESYKK